MRTYVYNYIASEVLKIAKSFPEIISLSQISDHTLLRLLKTKHKHVRTQTFASLDERPNSTNKIILLNGNLNYDLDIQQSLSKIRLNCRREDRLVCVLYNSYFRGLFRLANWIGIRSAPVPTVFITHSHLNALCKLSGFELVRVRPVGHFPFRFFGLGDLINTLMSATPLVRWFCFASVVILRPAIAKADASTPSLSIVIPARNEAGNIANAITRLSHFMERVPTAVIFVEGHSTDNTWDEIQKVAAQYASKYKILCLQQTGKGKVDAVRLGFSQATGDLLTILDADLTMPPEMIGRFYDAWVEGKGDFINGSRLVYPMEDESMRFLNLLGNIFFAKTLSFVLDSQITDSLCGTKLLSRNAYQRFCHWREEFGDFDPFGDFELIFPAAVLGLGIVDVPIVYKSRTYGSTNISRFRHGVILLKMTLIGFFKIKLISRTYQPSAQ